MAITVTPNLTDISMCETVTGWAGGNGYIAVDSDVELQGTYCMSDWVNTTTQTVVKYTLASATSMTGKHLYCWMYCSGLVDTKVNGGYRLYAETDASNYSYWYVGGNDTHGGGWQLMTVDLAATRDSGLGTLNVGSITKIGVSFKTLTPAPIKGQTRFNNVFWDAVRYGTGLTITSGATDAIGLEDIFLQDDNVTYKWGVVTKSFGAYVVQGKLVFGSESSGDVDFTDSNQIILFPDNDKVADSFYGITVVGNSGGTTNFSLGENSGGSGISGCTLKAVGSKTFSLDVSNTYNDTIGLYGSTFANAGTITLPTGATGREMLNCSTTTAGELIISTCLVKNCNFISADDEAVQMSSTSHQLSDSNFISNPYGVRITATGEYDFSNLQFTGNTVDIDNTSGGAVIVNLVDTSNATTETGDTTLVSAPVTTTITVKDLSTGLAIAGAAVLVWVTDDANYFYKAGVSITGSGTTATVSHTGHGLTSGDFVVIEGVANDDDYNGVFEVTVTGVDSYTYTTTETLGTSPASPTLDYYFNASDASISDPNSVWYDDAYAFDGDTGTYATTTTTGSTSSNFLLGEGTNAPTSGATVSQVRARIYANCSPGTTAYAAIYTNGLGELLGTPSHNASTASWGSYTTLSAPTGGWTWEKISDLEVKIYGTLAGGLNMHKVELEVTVSTITSTMALISDTTDSNGQASDTRVLGANQTIVGWVRKSTSTPFYQQGVVSGTVDNSNGFSATIQLARDD